MKTEGNDSPRLSTTDLARLVHLVRGRMVMLTHELAPLYGVTTSNLNKAVHRNPGRFPDDFMFRLSSQEWNSLTFQIGMSKKQGRGGRRALPFAFTEQGIAMLSSVLNSERAIQVNIQIMRTFVRMGKAIASDAGFRNRLKLIEERAAKHDAYFVTAFNLIKKLESDRGPRTLRFLRGDDPREGDPN